MFNFNKKSQRKALNDVISDLLEELEGMNGSHHHYPQTSDEVIKLMKLKKDLESGWRPSPDAIVGAAASVVGILLIIHHEKVNNIGSKALGFVTRMK